jgi:hypothetical protein
VFELLDVVPRDGVGIETEEARVGTQVTADERVSDVLETLVLERAQVLGSYPGAPGRLLDRDADVFAGRAKGRAYPGGCDIGNERHANDHPLREGPP